jgi:drug/metabolite transporter (DMT)-like permease
VGLIGALSVIRPGLSSYGWTTALPLLSALAYACNMIVMKRACATRSSLTLQCGATMFAAAIMAVAILILFAIGTPSLVPIANDAGVWRAILGTGAFAAASFVLIAEAFRRADASTLAPLQYLEIIGATLAGWFVFSTFPDGLTWFGLGIILCSGLYVYHREGGAATAAPRRIRGGR